MGIFNENSTSSDTISSGVQGQQGPPGPQGIGFKLDSNNNYDMQNKKLINVKPGTDNHDVVTKNQIALLDSASPGIVVNDKAVIYSDTGSVHTQNLYLKDAPDDGLSNELRILTPHQSYNNIHLNIPDLKNFNGYGGRPSSEMMITSVDQTVTGKKTFQNIEVPTPTSNNQASTKYYVDHNFLNRLTGGQIGGDLDMRGHTIKYLKLDNTGSAAARVAELKKKVDLSGSTMTGNLNMGNKQITNLGYSISDPTDVINLGFSDQKYLQKVSDSDLDMDDHRIKNSLEPINSRDLTTKNYVDNQMGTKADLSKTTTQTFQGRIQVPNFNSGSHSGSDIVNLKYINDTFLNKKTGGSLGNSISFISSLPSNQRQIFNLAPPQFSSSATSKSYVDDEIAKIPQSPQVNTSQFIRKDGTVPMTSNLDLGGNKISNLRLPTNNEDAASKKYIDDTLAQSHLLASSKKNEFTYLDSPDDTSSEYNVVVNSFTDFNSSPHRNKKAYSITLQKDAGTNNYRSRMGFNLFPLPLGTYTIIFEFFPREMTNIQLSCQATSAYIHKTVQKDFSSYSKMLVQINNNSKNTPDYIYLTMHGTATATPAQGYLIVYGTKDWSDSLNPEIYDHVLTKEMFEYDDGIMKMNNDIDMNNHHITNLSDGTRNSDAINKKQLDDVDVEFKNTSRFIENYLYRSIFKNGFHDLIDPGHFVLSQTNNGAVIDSVSPNFYLGIKRFIRDYSSRYGLVLSAKSYIKTPELMNQNSSFTFFMSFVHNPNKMCEISFSNTLTGVKYHPYYRIGNNTIIIDNGTNTFETVFTYNFRYKKIFIWICYDGDNNLHKMALSNFSTHISETFNPPTRFSTDQLEINYEAFINKVAFLNEFIDVNSLQHHYIQFNEKRNGSYLEI